MEYKKLYQRFYFETLLHVNAFSAIVGAPLTVLFFIWKTEISLSNLYMVIVPGIIVFAVVTAMSYFMYDNILAPFRWYFTSKAKNTAFDEKHALMVKERLSSLTIIFSLGLIVQWLIGLLVFSLSIALLYGITFDQLLYVWFGGILSVAVSLFWISYNIPKTIDKLTQKGIFDDIKNSIGTKPITVFGSLIPILSSSASIVNILIVIILVTFGIVVSHNYIQKIYEQNIQITTNQVGHNFDTLIEDTLHDCALLAIHPDRNTINRLVSLKQKYEDMAIVDASILSGTNKFNAIIQRALVNKVELSKGFITKPVQSESDNKEYVVVGLPIGGKIYAALFSILQLKKFLLDTVTIGNSGYIFIAYNDGSGLMHPAMSIVNDSLHNYEWGKKLLTNQNSFISYRFNNEDKFGYSFTTNMGFLIIASILRSELNEYSRFLALISLGVGLFWSAIGTIILFRNIKRHLEPLVQAREVISIAAKGDLTQHLDIIKGDEVGILATSVNILIEKLRVAISQIIHISDELASSSTQMSQAITSFTDNVQNEASTVEEISATIEEISAGMENVARRADSQNQSLSSLIGLLKNLSHTIQRVADTMNDSVKQVEIIADKSHEGSQSLNQMNTTMQVLAKSSDDMKNIIKIINDISEQINLLSLNAAIEAARAGDFGRGFAVVADEISKLADQTAQSIKEIDTLIKQNSAEMGKGSQNINQAIQTIGYVINGVKDISQHIEQVALEMKEQLSINARVQGMISDVQTGSEQIKHATEEQRVAIMEISRSISSINELSQSNAGAAEEMSANASGVEQLAVKLREMVSFFTLS
ncbi:MAG: methyl-accepting chemotaxis protein [Spirochaetota bacterium]